MSFGTKMGQSKCAWICAGIGRNPKPDFTTTEETLLIAKILENLRQRDVWAVSRRVSRRGVEKKRGDRL